MIERGQKAWDSHPRPGRLYGDPAMVDYLMAASWWNIDKVPQLLLCNIDHERRILEFVHSNDMALKIQLVPQLLEILSNLRSRGRCGHKPEGGAGVIRGVTH